MIGERDGDHGLPEKGIGIDLNASNIGNKLSPTIKHIQKHRQLYLASTGHGTKSTDAIYLLIKEILNNSVDEYLLGHTRRIDVLVKKNIITVRDYGNGISFNKLVDRITELNTGIKHNDDLIQYTEGFNGLGLKLVCAFSENFILRSYINNVQAEAYFNYGNLVVERRKDSDKSNGLFIRFNFNEKLLGRQNLDLDILQTMFNEIAACYPGLQLTLNSKLFQLDKGMQDLLQLEHKDSIAYKAMRYRANLLDFSFSHSRISNGELSDKSFVNGKNTLEGGKHLVPLKTGVFKACKQLLNLDISLAEWEQNLLFYSSINLVEPEFTSTGKLELSDLAPKLAKRLQDDSFRLTSKILQNNTSLRNAIKAYFRVLQPSRQNAPVAAPVPKQEFVLGELHNPSSAQVSANNINENLSKMDANLLNSVLEKQKHLEKLNKEIINQQEYSIALVKTVEEASIHMESYAQQMQNWNKNIADFGSEFEYLSSLSKSLEERVLELQEGSDFGLDLSASVKKLQSGFASLKKHLATPNYNLSTKEQLSLNDILASNILTKFQNIQTEIKNLQQAQNDLDSNTLKIAYFIDWEQHLSKKLNSTYLVKEELAQELTALQEKFSTEFLTLKKSGKDLGISLDHSLRDTYLDLKKNFDAALAANLEKNTATNMSLETALREEFNALLHSERLEFDKKLAALVKKLSVDDLNIEELLGVVENFKAIADQQEADMHAELNNLLEETKQFLQDEKARLNANIIREGLTRGQLREYQEGLSQVTENYRTEVELELRNSLEEAKNLLNDKVYSFIKDYEGQLTEDISVSREETKVLLKKEAIKLHKDLEESIGKVEDSLQVHINNRYSSFQTNYDEELSKNISDLETKKKELLDLLADTGTVQLELKANIDKELGRLKELGTKIAAEALDNLNTEHGSLEELFTKLQVSIQSESSEIIEKLQHNFDLSIENMNSSSAQLLADLETKAKYNHELLDKFEAANLVKLKEVEKNLNTNIGILEEKIDAYTVDISAEIHKGRSALDDLHSLDQELNKQTQVYSDELRIVIGELETQLGNELTQIERSIREEFDLLNVDISARDLASLQELKRLDEQANSRLESIKLAIDDKILSSQNHSEEQIKKLSSELLARWETNIHDDFAQWDTTLKLKIKETEEQELQNRQDLYSSFKDELNSYLEKQRLDLLATTKNLEDDIASKILELENRILESDGILNKHLQQESEAVNTKMRDVIDSLSQRYNNLLDRQFKWEEQLRRQNEDLRDDLESDYYNSKEIIQKDSKELLESTSLERKLLREDLDELQQKLHNSLEDVNSKEQQFEDSIKNKTEYYLNEFNRLHRDGVQNARDNLAELRQQILGLREKVEQQRMSMFETINDNTHLLDQRMSDIEKRQVESLENTQKIEHALELKEEISNDIDYLKNQSQFLDKLRAQVNEMKADFSKNTQLSQDVVGRIQEFKEQERQLDMLEERMEHLLKASNQWDAHWDELDASNKQLEAFRNSFKDLKNLYHTSESLIKKLEQKSMEFGSAESSIIANNDLLNSISLSLAEVKEQFVPIENDLQKVQVLRENLEQQEQSIIAAGSKVDSIQESIKDIDDNISKIAVTREWIANTETRMQRMSKDIHENLQTIENIVSRQQGQSKNREYLADNETRNTVIQLRHKGWNTTEIARASKLSIGEVELILEMSSR